MPSSNSSATCCRALALAKDGAMDDATLAWVQCSHVARTVVFREGAQAAQARVCVHPGVTWSPAVVTGLLCLEPSAQRAELVQRIGHEPALWREMHKPLLHQVLGLALIRPLCAANPLTYLSAAQREVKRYWERLLRSEQPLFFFEVAKFAAFADPQRAHAQGAPNYSRDAQQARTVVFDVTEASSRRLWSSPLATGCSLQDELLRWGQVASSPRAVRVLEAAPPTMALAIPTPHALLLKAGSWTSHALPMPLGRGPAERALRKWLACRRLVGMTRSLHFEEADDTGHPGCEDEGLWAVVPERVQRASDLLRMYATSLSGDEKEEVAWYVQWMQRLHESMVSHGATYATQAYKVDHLIQCVVFSGFLREVQQAGLAMQIAIQAAAPSPAWASVFLDTIRQSRVLPSRSALYEHRLTVHLGWCLAAQAEVQQLVAKAGPVVYITVDSSPQGGCDWLQHSITFLQAEELRAAFDAACRLSAVSDGIPCEDEDGRLRSNSCSSQVPVSESETRFW